MAYRRNSGWDDSIEMCCLLIMRMCYRNIETTRGTLCDRLAEHCGVLGSSLKAKVSDYKKLCNEKREHKCSSNSIRIYNQYEKHSIEQLKKEIVKIASEAIKKWLKLDILSLS